MLTIRYYFYLLNWKGLTPLWKYKIERLGMFNFSRHLIQKMMDKISTSFPKYWYTIHGTPIPLNKAVLLAQTLLLEIFYIIPESLAHFGVGLIFQNKAAFGIVVNLNCLRDVVSISWRLWSEKMVFIKFCCDLLGN